MGGRGGGGHVHEKTSAAAAPRKPKKGAVSSPLNADDIFPLLLLRREREPWGALVPRPPLRRVVAGASARGFGPLLGIGLADLI